MCNVKWQPTLIGQFGVPSSSLCRGIQKEKENIFGTLCRCERGRFTKGRLKKGPKSSFT